MTKPPSIQEALAADLRDLNLSNLGGRVLEGRISIAHALAHLARQRSVKLRMLELKAGRGSTGTSDMRERLAEWCEKATETLEHYRDWTPTS